MHYRDFAACIFDMDGVLIDSEPLHAQAKRDALEHFHIAYPEHVFADFKGRSDKDFIRHAVEQLSGGQAPAAELTAFKHARYYQLFENAPQVPGAMDFLAQARRCFKKLALVTSATRHDFSMVDRKFQLQQWLDAIVTVEATARHKPEPEPYLHALQALGVEGAAALVIEDSPSGIRSARAAGCQAAGITTAFEAEVLLAAGANLVVATFSELRQALGMDAPGPG